MTILSHHLYRASQVRELDRIAIETFGIPGAILMSRAGAAVFMALREHWPRARSVAVVCGTGKNGGDGFVAARLAHAAGMKVAVFQVGDPASLRGDALHAAEALNATGIAAQPFAADVLTGFDTVVDALFGTGLDREVTGEWRAAVEAINGFGAPVLAVDIPSGLDSDTGRILGAAVRAQATVTFIGLKQGMFTGDGPACCGVIEFNDLRLPVETYAGVSPFSVLFDAHLLRPLLPPRPRSAHKGHHGHTLVIGGDHGMTGAARLAGEAAARSGSGLTSIATRANHAAMIAAACPELMCHAVEQVRDLHPLLERASVIAIGPGLGQSAWARELFCAALETALPLVVDADALNLLAQEPVRRDNWILTPHPGEAARLLDCSTADIQADRFRAIGELQQRFDGVCVLKGAGTLIDAGQAPITVCAAGNPGMASGGMGDVLTGVIAGLLAQGLPLADAARLGVYVHATAGDQAAEEEGERGLLASDLMPHIHHLLNP
ncbi:MAG: NAD(P)H-hydrate dehydratase [Pseudomonadota bacterium]